MDRKFNPGDEVYWNDPDDGISSGYYIVVKYITDEILALRSEDWSSELEAFESELS